VVLMKPDSVGLRGARDMMPGDLSGGMTRRVKAARHRHRPDDRHVRRASPASTRYR
jgi:ABC-type thiamine transport system ATPase subunit